jgi:hypothetical protein
MKGTNKQYHLFYRRYLASYHLREADEDPLFLYIAYTAAHSPLQHLPHHSLHCSHIPHLWRREYCGLVV